MNEPTHTEAVQTDLSSRPPSRRKRPYGRPLLGRLALRFAVLVAAVSVLGAAYWFTRPQELVWWRSPPWGKQGRHVRGLIPLGWEWDKSQSSQIKNSNMEALFLIHATNK